MHTKKILSEIILKAGEKGLNLQNNKGVMPPGHNGPYYDPETPVRNTAHWLFLFSALYMNNGDAKWRTAGEKAIAYLLSPKARPYDKTFLCREKRGKDKCNGLIGQAWVIEALVKASEAFGRNDIYEVAENIFLLHPWDRNIGVWKRVEVDGTELSLDITFNHQLWFAAVGGMLKNTPAAQIRAKYFLEKVAPQVELYPFGIIFHSSVIGSIADYLKKGFKPFVRELKSNFNNRVMKKKLYSKSAGYHGFNLYAFSMLKNTFPDANFWKTDKFKTLIAAHRNNNFVCNVNCSEFGYRYNLSGIEIAYAVETFFDDKQEATYWLNNQFKKTYLNEANPLSRGACDLNTATARIYEATRLSEEYEVIVD